MIWLHTTLLVLTSVGAGGIDCPRGMSAVPSGSLADAQGQSTAIATFCLDRTEVSLEAYAACVEAGVCQPARETVQIPNMTDEQLALWSRACNARDRSRVAHPVNCVDHGQADAYCSWRGVRLPTSPEWSWAAQGGEEARPFPWGSVAPSERRTNACGSECRERFQAQGLAWRLMYYGDDRYPNTAPVGKFQRGAGRWGHLNLAGNVWEHVSGEFEGSDAGIIRGGGWAQTKEKWLRSDATGGYLDTSRGSAVGFRCAATP